MLDITNTLWSLATVVQVLTTAVQLYLAYHCLPDVYDAALNRVMKTRALWDTSVPFVAVDTAVPIPHSL